MLNLYHLKYFYDAAQSESLLSAAQVNHVSSQAISQAIQSLERNLGLKLLIHQKNRFRLTSQGEKLRCEAMKLLNAANILKSELEKETGKVVGNIELASTGSVFHYILNPLLGEYIKNNTDVALKAQLAPTSKVIDYLSRDNVAMGAVLFDSRIHPYECVELAKGRYTLLSKGPVDLAAVDFFIKEEGPESWDFEKKYFQQFKKYPNIRGVMGSWESMLDYVDNGLGVGLVPDFIRTRTRRKFYEPVLSVPLTDYRIVMAFKSREHLPDACKNFLDFFESRTIN
jgi:DNA-binding transcriptional LysR family regulator